MESNGMHNVSVKDNSSADEGSINDGSSNIVSTFIRTDSCLVLSTSVILNILHYLSL